MILAGFFVSQSALMFVMRIYSACQGQVMVLMVHSFRHHTDKTESLDLDRHRCAHVGLTVWGAEASRLLENYARAVEVTELAARIDALEKKVDK